MDSLKIEHEIVELLVAYTVALDNKDWSSLDQVFHPDINVDYAGMFQLEGRERSVEMIRSMLETCGATQHMISNYRIEVDGDRARSRCYVCATHAGRGLISRFLHFTMHGEYRDEFLCTEAGWRITRRELHISHRKGTMIAMGSGLWRYLLRNKAMLRR
jgi:3-phenylpropionate/cinnamic acid dioxygenase small subunit